MTDFEKKLAYCRIWVKEWAATAALTVVVDGEGLPGQALVIAWMLKVPISFDKLPGAKGLSATFSVHTQELNKSVDECRALMKKRFVAAVVVMWELATQNLKDFNISLAEKESGSDRSS